MRAPSSKTVLDVLFGTIAILIACSAVLLFMHPTAGLVRAWQNLLGPCR